MKTTAEFCCVLNGNGRAKKVPLKKTFLHSAEQTWVHIDYTDDENQEWLRKQNLPPMVLENLLDSDTTPRYFKERRGVLVVMRGVNANYKTEEDMVAVHIWMTKNCLLSMSHRSLPAIAKMLSHFEEGKGPTTVQDCFVQLAYQINARIEKTLLKINDESDALEEDVISETSFHQDTKLRHRLSMLRHKIVGLRRYLVPQRDMMNKLCADQSTLFEETDLKQLQEISRDLSAIVSELDYARDHSAVTQEELDSKTNIEMSRTMYLMSLIMVIFTPLTFLTGLLGANVGGIPLSEHPNGFWGISLVLFILGCIQMLILKKVRWF